MQDDPEERPTFREIYKKLEELYPNNVVSEEEIAEKKLGRSENYREQDDIVVVEDAKVMNSGTTYDDYPSEYPSEIPLLRDRRGEESEQLKEWEKEEAGKLQKGKKGRKGTVSKGKGTKKVKSNKRDKDPMPSKIPTGEPQPDDQELGNAEKEAMTEYGDDGNDENKHQGKRRENEKIPDKKEAIISMLTQYGDEGPFEVATTTDKKSDSERAEKQKEKEASIRLLTQYDDGSEGALSSNSTEKAAASHKEKKEKKTNKKGGGGGGKKEKKQKRSKKEKEKKKHTRNSKKETDHHDAHDDDDDDNDGEDAKKQRSSPPPPQPQDSSSPNQEEDRLVNLMQEYSA